jgi:Mg/Co/Ni transporter MgtE
MCSEKIKKMRLRRATFLPVVSQNCGSSGRQSSIHLPPRLGGGDAGAETVFSGALAVGVRVGTAMASTVATAGFPGVAPRLDSCSVSLTAADPLW